MGSNLFSIRANRMLLVKPFVLLLEVFFIIPLTLLILMILLLLLFPSKRCSLAWSTSGPYVCAMFPTRQWQRLCRPDWGGWWRNLLILANVVLSLTKNRGDNIIIVQEVIHAMKSKKGKNGWVAIKVDL